jgi:two-component system, sensor histidine kinase
MARADDPTQLLDDGPPSQQGSPSLRVSWLWLLGMLLGLALLAVALVQARQYALLKASLQPGHDFGALTLFESETDYLRLREAWRQVAQAPNNPTPEPPDPPDPPELRVAQDLHLLKERYELWADRVGLLREARARALFGDNDDYRRALAQMDAFLAAADRAFGQQPVVDPSRAFVQGLLPALEALDEPVHAVALGASHRLARQLEKRAELVRTQNQFGLGLTVFLCLFSLLVGSLVWRQVRRLRERRSALEELANTLHQARQEALSSSDAKSTFLANMSHEIRTPFHGLMGMLSLLRETGLSARQIDYLRTATESADHLLAILNDILDMSQLESGRMSLSPTPVALRGMLRDVEALMRPQAMGKSLALHIDADPGLPEHVMLDATRVKQILFNLLSNAIKFSERGAVVLDLRWHDRSSKKSTVTGLAGVQGLHELEFVVTDTGQGMSPATLDRLFNRFMQGDATASRRHGGAGLGLEISRNLARLMNGDITVNSTLGKGSCFTLRLPVQALSPQDEAQATALAPRTMPLRALQVLVAEDHPVNRQYLSALLEGLGHQAHFAANGEEAVRAASARPFDLVLMDLHMPVLDGLGATRAIRALPDPRISTLPIVALTADALDETRERCLMAGMNDFLTKPVSPQILATSLRRLFGSATSAEALPHADTQAHVHAHLHTHTRTSADPGATLKQNPRGALANAGASALVDEAAVGMALQAVSLKKMSQLLESFLAQGPQTVERLRAAVRAAQTLELRVNAHAAKGAALNLGLAGLAATAEALQQGAAHLPAHEIARLVQRYEDQLATTKSALRSLGLIGPRRPSAAPGLPGRGVAASVVGAVPSAAPTAVSTASKPQPDSTAGAGTAQAASRPLLRR